MSKWACKRSWPLKGGHRRMTVSTPVLPVLADHMAKDRMSYCHTAATSDRKRYRFHASRWSDFNQTLDTIFLLLVITIHKNCTPDDATLNERRYSHRIIRISTKFVLNFSSVILPRLCAVSRCGSEWQWFFMSKIRRPCGRRWYISLCVCYAYGVNAWNAACVHGVDNTFKTPLSSSLYAAVLLSPVLGCIVFTYHAVCSCNSDRRQPHPSWEMNESIATVQLTIACSFARSFVRGWSPYHRWWSAPAMIDGARSDWETGCGGRLGDDGVMCLLGERNGKIREVHEESREFILRRVVMSIFSQLAKRFLSLWSRDIWWQFEWNRIILVRRSNLKFSCTSSTTMCDWLITNMLRTDVELGCKMAMCIFSSKRIWGIGELAKCRVLSRDLSRRRDAMELLAVADDWVIVLLTEFSLEIYLSAYLRN